MQCRPLRSGPTQESDEMTDYETLEDHDHYRISTSADSETILFEWKHAPGLSAGDFAAGITNYATHCTTHQAAHGVIDARALDPDSQAMAWLRGKTDVEGLDPYDTWWAQTILPLYHKAGLVRLGVATGDPNSPGEVPSAPEVNFKMGYFHDTESASSWTT